MKLSSSDYRPCLYNQNPSPDSLKSKYAKKVTEEQKNKFDKMTRRDNV